MVRRVCCREPDIKRRVCNALTSDDFSLMKGASGSPHAAAAGPEFGKEGSSGGLKTK